jgi:hypothetical protein
VGNEATVRARVRGEDDEGKALLETNELVFRGKTRIAVKFSQTRDATTHGPWLILGELSLRLGVAEAKKWAEKIRSPKSVLDKLGVKPGQTATLLGDAGDLADQLAAKGLSTTPKLSKNAALVFFFADAPKDLSTLKTIRKQLAPDGTLWLLRRKGKDAPIPESVSRAAGLAAGFVDVKVVGFSETHSAEKWVIPLKDR